MTVVKYACYSAPQYVDHKTFNNRDHHREGWDRVVEIYDDGTTNVIKDRLGLTEKYSRDKRPDWAKKAYKVLDWISTVGFSSLRK